MTTQKGVTMIDQRPLGTQTSMDFAMPETVKAFWEFHRKNPMVYAELKSLAKRALARGHKVSGIGFLAELYRWEKRTMYFDEFKLNNNHKACYARLLMSKEPELRGMFRLRHSEADAWFPNG